MEVSFGERKDLYVLLLFFFGDNLPLAFGTRIMS